MLQTISEALPSCAPASARYLNEWERGQVCSLLLQQISHLFIASMGVSNFLLKTFKPRRENCIWCNSDFHSNDTAKGNGTDTISPTFKRLGLYFASMASVCISPLSFPVIQFWNQRLAHCLFCDTDMQHKSRTLQTRSTLRADESDNIMLSDSSASLIQTEMQLQAESVKSHRSNKLISGSKPSINAGDNRFGGLRIKSMRSAPSYNFKCQFT